MNKAIKPCAYCGAPMDNPRRIQCGADACKRARAAERMRAWQREHKAKTGEWYSHPLRSHTCIECGKTWQSRSADSQYCGNECRSMPAKRQREAEAKQVVLYRKPPWWTRPAPSAPKRLRKRWFVGMCILCAAVFVSDQPANRTCSSSCSKKIARRLGKDRRRALMKQAFVEKVYRRKIFERDGWKCRLCGKPVDRTAEVPSPHAATIDHIIPLAKGGTHEAANAQCAHYRCNTRKGDRGGGEQLLIFG